MNKEEMTIIEKKRQMDWLIGYLLLLYTVVSPISLSATNVVLGLIILSGVGLMFNVKGGEAVRFPAKLLTLFLLLFFWLALSRLLSGGSLDKDAVSNIWEYSQIILLPTFLSVSKVRKDRVVTALLISSTLVCILGTLQFFVPSIVYPIPRQLAMGYFQGFFSNRLHTGGFYSIIVVLSFALVLFWKCEGRNKLYLWIFFLLNLFALSISMTRSYYISVSLTILILLFIKSWRWFSFGSVLFVVILSMILIFPNPVKERLKTISDPNFSSNKARIYIWKAAIDMFKDHPLVGVGYGNWTKEAEEHYYPLIEKEYNYKITASAHAHNIYLTKLAETGLIGLFLFLLFWLSVAWSLYSKLAGAEKGTFDHGLSVGTLGGIGNLFLAGMFENNFGTSVIVLLISFLIGLSLDLKPKSLQVEG